MISAVACLAQPNTPRVSFNRDIRPILSDACFACHGPDKNTRMAGLRLDLREEALRKSAAGTFPIVPGRPDESSVIARVFEANPARRMPPKFSHKELTTRQKELLRQWIQDGAPYEGHWSYLPLKPPPLPSPPPGFPVRNAIDHFIQTRLAQAKLTPSPEADRRTLIRRLTLDLTGLPPSQDEVALFLADRRPDAYERLVDRLLESPRYAEKQALHWLDAVRYADTCGFHGDNAIPAWPYRDYVLRSFLHDKPFDIFTREQLAGDLIPGAGPEQKVASAYNRLNRTSAEGGLQPKEYLAKYGADRVRTLGAVWLGGTIGCAECHDHKFDPYTLRDFYSMKAFFADIKETGLVPDRGPMAFGSQAELPDEAQILRRDSLRRKIALLRQGPQEPPDPAWEAQLLRRFKAGEFNWRFQRRVTATAANGTILKTYDKEEIDNAYELRGSVKTDRKPGMGLIVASGPMPDTDVYTVRVTPGPGVWTALGLEVVSDDSLAGARLARGSDRFLLSEVEAEMGGRKLPITLATSSATLPRPDAPAMAAIDGDPRTGWGVAHYGEPRNPFLALRLAEPLRTTAQSVLILRLRQESPYRRATLGRFRIALSSATHSSPGAGRNGAQEPEATHGLPPLVVEALEDPGKRKPAHEKALADYRRWVKGDARYLEAARLEAELDLLESRIPRVLVTETTEPAVTRILPRGNFLDESGDIVEPALPAFLGTLQTGGRRATRLDLANWLVSPSNPLTPRVTVNRVWRQFFGAGLSKTLDDLGSQGEWPAHPELLDWLAADFARHWRMKRLIKLIVMSHTYRQDSMPRADANAVDPDNRLLARQNRFRVEAESVRDIALSVSGLLSERFGGPSVKPHQPFGYLAALNFPKRDYSASHGEDLYRRGIYTHWQRTFLYPSLAIFDAPSREECTVNRAASNTPLQALVLLNDPVFVEAARVFAQRILAEGGATTAARIGWAWREIAGRDPDEKERRILTSLYETSLRRFRAFPAEAAALAATGEAPLAANGNKAELAAMTVAARALLNTHEAITRY